MKKFAVLATVLTLIVLYANIDRQALLHQLRQIDLGVFLLSVGFFVPQMLVTAVRWQCMAWDVCPMGTLEATRLILAGKALNAVVPSKLGEMSKAYFLRSRANLELSHGMALVLLEKLLDVAGLCAILLLGVMLTPRRGPVETTAALGALSMLLVSVGVLTVRSNRLSNWRCGRRALLAHIGRLLTSWNAIVARWKQHGGRFAAILLLSWALWGLHVTQIYLFFVALHSDTGPRLVFAYVPISIFIGLVPLTIGGMGTRDSALILLFAPYESAAVMAGVGILCSLRYWMDTLLGLPFFHQYSFEKH